VATSDTENPNPNDQDLDAWLKAAIGDTDLRAVRLCYSMPVARNSWVTLMARSMSDKFFHYPQTYCDD